MEKSHSNKINTVFEISAGGVIFKKEEGWYFVVLIAPKNKTVWTLPKGLIEKGETPEETAIREVKEETGCLGKIVQLIDKNHIWFYSKENNATIRHHKLIYYYLLKFIKGDTAKHDNEVCEARWFKIERAIDTVTYISEKKILKKAKDILYENSNIHTS